MSTLSPPPTSPSPPPSKKTCSTCNIKGHNKKTCPLLSVKPLPTYNPFDEIEEMNPVIETPDTALIRTLATEVLEALGAGHTESVYHCAMKIAIQDAGLKFETERDIIIKFRDRYVGTVRADLIVEGRLVIELKASSGSDTAVNDALEQCRIYMRETKTPSGMVVVFPKKVGGKLVVASA
jgi:GxxExxY protein